MPEPEDLAPLAPGHGSADAASRTVLGRGLLYTLGTAAPVLSNAVATPVVTRLIGPAPFGVVSAAIVVIQVGMIVAGLGLAAAITRHGILERSGVEGARSLVLRGAVIAAVLCGIGAVVAPLIAARTPLADGAALALALAASAGFATVVAVQSYLRVLDRPLPFVTLSLTSAAGGPLVGMALLVLWEATATAYLVGLMIGYVATGLGGLALTLAGGPRRHEPGDLARALRIGVPTIPHQVALYLAAGVLVLVATWSHGQAAAGRLQLAVLIGSAPGVLTASLNNAWAPVVYRTPEEHRGAVLERTSRDIGWLTALAAGFVAVLAPVLLRIVAPPTYDPTAMTPATAWVAAGTVLSVLYLANVHLVFASGRSDGLALVTPLSLGVGTLVAVLAARAWGVTWTAVGMTVTYAALALGVMALAHRVSPTRWRWSTLLGPLALGGALCVVGGLAPTGGAGLWARVVVGALLLAGAMAFLLRVRRR